MPSPLAKTILATLLDRFEQPTRQQVVRVRLNKRQHPAYYDERDGTPRLVANKSLQHLEQQGLVQLHWVKWEEGNWLKAVDLLDADALYALLGRMPRNKQEAVLRELLAQQTSRAPWHAAFLDWVRVRLDAHRSIAPLKLNDPANNRDLLLALDGIAALQSPTLERRLSVRLFGDSKRLEALRSAVLTVLRHHDPEAKSYGGEKWALLRAHHLDRVPEYIPLAGPLLLKLSSGSTWLDIAPFTPSVALSAAMLRDVTLVECSATTVLTIENASSFSEWVTLRPADVLTFYTGGFASPTVIALLQRIQARRPDLPFYHWGDLDAGGLRILAHLRTHLRDITPLAMDVATFEQYRRHAKPLTKPDRAALRTLLDLPLLSDCVDLIKQLLAADKKLEQEAVEIKRVRIIVTRYH